MNIGSETGLIEARTAACLGILSQVEAGTIVPGALSSADAVLDGFLNGAVGPGSRSC